MKPHILPVIAFVLILTNLFISARFVMSIMAIMHLQYHSRVQLPVQKSHRSPVDLANTFKVVLKSDGVAYVDDLPESDTAVLYDIQQRKPERIRLMADRRVRYERLKLLLGKLSASGAQVVVAVADDVPASPHSEAQYPVPFLPRP